MRTTPTVKKKVRIADSDCSEEDDHEGEDAE